MKKDLYVDAIMGEWKHDKKGSNKKNLCYKRRATIQLHKDFALPYRDPEDMQEYNVYGEVTLTETKLIDVATSHPSFFRGLELTKDSKKDIKII